MAVDGVPSSGAGNRLRSGGSAVEAPSRAEQPGLAATGVEPPGEAAPFGHVPLSHHVKTTLGPLDTLRPDVARVRSRAGAGKATVTLYVSPAGSDVRTASGDSVRCVAPSELAAAIARASQEGALGVTVELTPGTYRQPIVLDGVQGITLKGGPQVVFDGGVVRPPDRPLQEVVEGSDGRVSWTPSYPDKDQAGLIAIRNSSDVRIEGIRIQNNWPNLISIHSSADVKISNVTFVGGTNAVYAQGRGTTGVSLNASTWMQDPSGPPSQLWSSLDWAHVHHGKYAYYNGAFFQALDIDGAVTITGNRVRDAFNAIRIQRRDPTGATAGISIQGNHFERVSDNVIEPEGGSMKDWEVRNNTFVSFHKPISLDGVTKGENFVFERNRFVAGERARMQQDPASATDGSRHNGASGGVFFKLKRKIGGQKVPPDITGLRVVNNSFSGAHPYSLKDSGIWPPGTVLDGNRFATAQ